MSEDVAAETLDRLLAVTLLLGADMSSHLGARGLTESRAGVLHVLGQSGPTTQRTLADALDVAPRTITGLVDGLVASGHVTREPHPTDRRATLVTPTEHGAAAAADLVSGRLELAGQLFAGWWPDRLVAFNDGLDVVLDTLQSLLEEES